MPARTRGARRRAGRRSRRRTRRTRARRAPRRACRPTVASTVRSPVRSRSPTNSSRNRRRRLLSEREYRANSAPFTTSGRFVSAKTGPSRFVKYGRSVAASSSVNVSGAYSMGTGDGRRRSCRRGLADAGRAPDRRRSDEEAVRVRDRPRRRRVGRLAGRPPSTSSGDGADRPRSRSGGRCAWRIRGCGTWAPVGEPARASRAVRAGRSAYTWTSARPSPGWPRGTRSMPAEELPDRDHDGRGPAR